MKNILLIFIALSLIVSCKQKSTSEAKQGYLCGCEFILSELDYKEANIPIYEASDALKSILDTVIETEINCPKFIPECKKGYIIYVEKFDDFCDIGITTTDYFTYHTYDSYGVIVYKRMKFFCYGDIIESLMTKTVKIFSVKYLSENNLIQTSSDNNSSWGFKWENNKVSYLQYHACY